MDQYLIAGFQKIVEEWLNGHAFSPVDGLVRLDVTIEEIPESRVVRYHCRAIDTTSEEMRVKLEKFPILRNSISDLNFSVRVRNRLKRMEIRSIAQLVQHTADKLLEIRNFGPTCLDEVRQKLAKIGLSLAGEG